MVTLNVSALSRTEEKNVQKDSSAWWHTKQADFHARWSPAAMQGVCLLPVVAEKQGIRETVSELVNLLLHTKATWKPTGVEALSLILAQK